MKATAFIRKSASKNDTNSVATIYFRLRDGKKDIKAASELTINPNHGSNTGSRPERLLCSRCIYRLECRRRLAHDTRSQQ